jgi:hypothetical protein
VTFRIDLCVPEINQQLETFLLHKRAEIVEGHEPTTLYWHLKGSDDCV